MPAEIRLPRVAIIAFTAQPNKGSEYEVGWRWPFLTTAVSRPYVITRLACWNNIPAKVRLISGVRFKHIDKVTFIAIDWSLAPKIFPDRRLMRSHYLLWQIAVMLWLRSSRQLFTFVHHLTFVAVWFPPFCAFSGLPLVWGPIGTSPPVPEFYRQRLGMAGRIKYQIRRFVTETSTRLNPLIRMAASRVRRGFAISPYVRDLLPSTLQQRISVQPAIAIDSSWSSKDPEKREMRLLFVGRAMDFKMPILAHDVALQVLDDCPDATAMFIGEGLKAAFEGKRQHDRLEILPHIDQQALQHYYASSSVFLFPSFEPSGFVTLEAMVNGLPVICLEGTGAAFFSGAVPDLTVGLNGSYDQVRDNMAKVAVGLLNNADKLAQYGSLMRARVENFSWDQYRGFIEKSYIAMTDLGR